MKRGTETKLKFSKLRNALELRTWGVRGLLDSLWHFTQNNCPAGDIGRFTDTDIALGVDWGGDPSVLVSALTETGWVDASDEHRLVIHDWPDHCEDSIHMLLARHKQLFSNGTIPKLTKLSQQERDSLLPCLQRLAKKKVVRTKTAQSSTANESVRTETALPSLAIAVALPEPLPLPLPVPGPLPELGFASAKPLSSKLDRSVEIRAVIAHYQTHHPKSPATLTPQSKEWRLIAARLAEGFSADDLCAAIDGCHRTPHNIGENERGQQYLALELIVRNSSQVTRFMEAPDGGAVLSEKTQRTLRAGESWAARHGAEESNASD